MSARDLLFSEMRRALHRRAVHVLIAIAMLGVVILGLVAFFDSAGKSIAEMRGDGQHPAIMTNWWVSGSGDGILVIAVIPLLIGGLFGGATVAGAEWRAGTVTTILTWEPRRRRVQWVRTLSAFTLAAVIAVVLQALFLSATLPAVFAHGTTAGVDGEWWVGLFAAITRIAFLTGGVAVVGVAAATLGRGTAFAIGAVFGWMAVAENLVRGLKPSLEPLLIGDNLAIVLTWAQLEGAEFTRSAVTAALTLALYFGVIAAFAVVSFTRRDIAGVA